MHKIYIYGAGGHGRVIADTLKRLNHPVAGFITDTPLSNELTVLNGLSVYFSDSFFPNIDPQQYQFLIAIGNNETRRTVAERLITLGCDFAKVIHPSAQIGARVKILPGTVVMANAVVNCDTLIGRHSIVNTGVIIDHDCTIGDFCHISPGSTLCGHVQVGSGSWLQVGSQISPCTQIAKNTIAKV